MCTYQSVCALTRWFLHRQHFFPFLLLMQFSLPRVLFFHWFLGFIWFFPPTDHYSLLWHTHTYMHASHVKCLHLTGWSAGQSAVLIIGLGEVGGAAAVIRAFWCGLAERKGHTLNISGRTTGRDREGWSAEGDCPLVWWLRWLACMFTSKLYISKIKHITFGCN